MNWHLVDVRGDDLLGAEQTRGQRRKRSHATAKLNHALSVPAIVENQAYLKRTIQNTGQFRRKAMKADQKLVSVAASDSTNRPRAWPPFHTMPASP